MAILTNPFINMINSYNGLPEKPAPAYLSDELKQLFRKREVALYISMRQVLDQVTQLLADDEKIINMLPMTDEANSGYATDGIMGMYAPDSEATKQYRDAQSSLRGNRLMIFTNRRIIFFIVIEFMDDPKQYFSYSYESIKSIKLKSKYFRSADLEHIGKTHTYGSYTLDFETTDRHIFTEFLTKENGELFKQNLLTIPGMQHIEVGNKASRVNRLDYIFSNFSFSFKVFLWVGFGITAWCFIAAVATWIMTLLH
ncbi:PH domain-containing protein [Lapidilactobacillus gannanensis]|uniref:PH domain-containing protein n=1 Tax=Lapidilactobacillus gannanensis TaxID=2486002 RepID=A0ABW4BNS7_9LACO|nr:PH domain-containing protein [Lapidilactobacillus gannanensis]